MVKRSIRFSTSLICIFIFICQVGPILCLNIVSTAISYCHSILLPYLSVLFCLRHRCTQGAFFKVNMMWVMSVININVNIVLVHILLKIIFKFKLEWYNAQKLLWINLCIVYRVKKIVVYEWQCIDYFYKYSFSKR